MRLISDHDAALAILHSSSFVVPAVPAATRGIGWLRANVGRFSTGEAHERRRALSVAVLDTIPPSTLRSAGSPVDALARAMGVTEPVLEVVGDLVRDTAQAYQPGTGDDARADAAVERLVTVCGGVADETTAARIGVLVQACDATATLIARAATGRWTRCCGTTRRSSPRNGKLS